MDKKIIFMVREYNHLDQVTPIIDLLMDRYTIIILLSDKTYDYSKDSNLNYLNQKNENIKLFHLYDFYFKDSLIFKNIYKLYKSSVMKYNIEINKIKKLLYRIFANILNRALVLGEQKDIDFNEILLKFNINNKNSLLITDFGGDALYEKILYQTKGLNITSIGIVHGLNVHTNKLLITNQLSYLEVQKDIIGFDYRDYLDYMITYCDQGYNQLLNSKRDGSSNTIVKLPTLRYSKYWIEKKQKEEEILRKNINSKLKIVYMVTSENYNVWIEEEFRTLKMVSQIEGIDIVIKPHPRTLGTVVKMRSLESDNFTIVDNSVSSSSLINWCDIVMLTSSSILLECIAKKKPILYMKYLHCNSISIEKFPSLIYKAETRDDVLNTLEIFISNSKYSKINSKELEEYLTDYILNDDFYENSEIYLNFFQRLFDTISIKER